eukprot:CAMPEP_0183707746 /NCGR_PEP_ID=MMETSP0737-20130205/4228_1 /TAXON_ID=385413 /ORGANISM="Thalassiosira miniscula, Strain CCMP1093" /LENGTH=365 /DNA_ID=CAMNT_0025935475 /DNA_START=154 /DNA_END=1252 /DNA_ORIENTATION=+
MRPDRFYIAATTFMAMPLVRAIYSCSPPVHIFQLDLGGTCDPFSRSETAICFFAQGDAPGDLDLPVPLSRRRRFLRGWQKSPVLPENENELAPHIDHAKKFVAEQERRREAEAALDTTPTVVTSVAFLETDTSPKLNVINQDSSFFNTSLTNGDYLFFSSMSSELDIVRPLEDQLDLVPGAVILHLFGVSEHNTVLQNTVAWEYDNENCESQRVTAGDSIGWITLKNSLPEELTISSSAITTIATTSTAATMGAATVTATTLTTTTATAIEATDTPTKEPTNTASRSEGLLGKSTKSSKSVKAAKLLKPKSKNSTATSTGEESVSAAPSATAAAVATSGVSKSSKAKVVARAEKVPLANRRKDTD